MKYLGGRAIPTTLGDIVDPQQTAVLVIDMQNDFCHPDGVWPSRGMPIPTIGRTVANIRKLLEEARRSNVRLIYVVNTLLPGRVAESPAWIRFLMKCFKVESPEDVPEFNIDGTWGHRIVDELTPEKGEIVIKKHRSSAFVNTNLDLILRDNGIKTIITVGATTEGCVESTARDGQFYDYNIVTISDCVDSDSQANHEAALSIMSGRWDVIQSKDLIAMWAEKRDQILSVSRS